ncbi:unnamed protein product, partial [Tetraodon nigroviridis]
QEHRCSVCDLQLPSQFKLQDHMNLHTGTRPYCCAECGKRFCQIYNYRVHLRTHAKTNRRPVNRLMCRVCRMGFASQGDLKAHLESTHFEKEFYECDQCKQVFTSLKACENHVKLHMVTPCFQCETCERNFPSMQRVTRHRRKKCRHLFKCTDCSLTFIRKTALLKHSFSHLGLLPYTCLRCHCHFRLAKLYRRHKCEPGRITCVACLREFLSQEDFEQHKKDTGCWGNQEPKTDEIRCLECGEKFDTKEELKKHAGAHQRVLNCAECGKGFRSALLLMSHMGGHAGQTPCLCQICGLGFPHQQNYESHFKTCGQTPPASVKKEPAALEACGEVKEERASPVCAEQGLCSWMEANQFSGNFMAPGNPSKHQPDVLNMAWGLPGSAEAVGFKSVLLDHLQPPRQAQNQPQRDLGRQERPGGSQSQDAPERREVCHLLPEASSTSAPEARSSGQQQGEDACRGSFRRPQDSAGSPFSHTHHHFHHHHCPLTSCLPCPRLVRSHVPHVSCLCCQHSLAACSQENPQETDTQPQTGKGRAVGNASPLHPCMHCSASFSRPYQLLQHQRSEHAHKPPGFLCTECGRSFNSHSNLRIHLNVHTGARPYACPDCGKSFSQSGALKIHRRIHTGERPYSCEFCSRTFPHLSAVRTHERIHTGERPYHCSQCGKCFTQSGSLKIHTHRVHRGERPFVCSICGKGFSYQSGISFHYRTAHG